MALGDTFLWDPLGGTNEHLYIAITNPNAAGEFVAINLTTSSGGRYSITLHRGDHPYIRHDSDANFGDALVVDTTKLQAEFASRRATPREPMDLAHVEKIGRAAKDHPAASYDVQGLCAIQWP